MQRAGMKVLCHSRLGGEGQDRSNPEQRHAACTDYGVSVPGVGPTPSYPGSVDPGHRLPRCGGSFGVGA